MKSNNRFDLEKVIAQWRQQMLAAGIKAPSTLQELESHLREDIGNLVAAGNPEAAAFQMAVSRVGSPAALMAEYKLAKSGSSLSVIGLLTWAGLAAILAAVLLSRWVEGKCGLLLTAHVFSLTTGYGTALLAGGFGMCLIGAQRWGFVLGGQANALNRAIGRYTQISAVLVAVGLLLGMLWSKQNRGWFLGSDPRAIASVCVAAWLVAFSLVQKLTSTGNLGLARLSLVGNLIVGLAWFGVGASIHGYGIGGYWPLNVLLGVHLLFLAMSVVPGSKPLET